MKRIAMKSYVIRMNTSMRRIWFSRACIAMPMQRLTKAGYRNILVESGLGERIKKNIYSRNVIVSPNVIKRIENIGDKAFLQAVLGVK